MKKALIKGTTIYDVVDAVFDVHPAFTFVDVPDDTKAQQDTYVNGAVVKFVQPTIPAVDQSDLDLINKQMRALALQMRTYINQTRAGNVTQVTVAALKADFKTAFDALP